MDRRTFLFAAAAPLLSSCVTPFGPERATRSAQERLLQLEKELHGRIGVVAIDTGNNASFSYRGSERFAFCSTFKFLVAAAMLQKSVQMPELMQQRVSFTGEELKKSGYSPITEQHVDAGMTVAALCAAAVDYSDNGAANLLLKILGGPEAVTQYCRSIGDNDFRLDRWEPELNSAIPGDLRDTTTPFAMASNMHKLALGNALPVPQRAQLVDWLRANTTGDQRIRAGFSKDWEVGDKTGTGDYGVANDVGVLWHAQRAPVVVAIYTTQLEKDAKAKNEVVAQAARIVADWLT